MRRDAGPGAVDEVFDSERHPGFSGIEILGPSEGIDVKVFDACFLGVDVVVGS